MPSLSIICFMPSYNLLEQGYPFLEVILSSLNVCDKMYIYDGSSDSTTKVLSRIKNPRLIVLRGDWNFSSKNTRGGQVIAEVSNKLLDEVRRREGWENTFVYYVQANEVFHEETYSQIRLIPETYPNYRGYLLYYYGFYGTLLRGEQFRLRMAPLSKHVRVIHDGWTMNVFGGFLKAVKIVMRHEAGMMLKYGRLNDFLWVSNSMYRYVYTRRPVFRYSLLFRSIVTKKLETHSSMFKDMRFSEMREMVEKMRELKDEEFWREMIKVSEKVQGSGKREFPKVTIPLEDHPKVMRPLLSMSTYEPREEIIREINELREPVTC